MKTMVIGAKGQLGTEVARLARLRGEVIEAGSGTDILERIETDGPIFEKQILEKIDLVVNCAAFHSVQGCEEDPSRAFDVNAFAQRALIHHRHLIDAKFIYVSSNYVFDRGYERTMDETPSPGTVYGASKALGEYFTLAAGGYVARVSCLYGHRSPRSKGPNLIRKIVDNCRSEDQGLNFAYDISLSLTNAADAAKMILEAAKLAPGPYNCCNQGVVTAKDLVAGIADMLGIKKPLNFYKESPHGATLMPSACLDHVNRPAMHAVRDFLLEAGEI